MRLAWALVLVLSALIGPAWATPTEPHRVVVLQGLDKVTARVAQVRAAVGEETRFGSLGITPRACLVAPPIDPPESAAFLEIRDIEPSGGSKLVFEGWMLASTPGLSALEHPVYDVWVIACERPDPTVPSTPTTPPAKP